MEDQNKQGIFNLEVDADIKHNYLASARWTKFIAVFMGITLVLGLVASYPVGVALSNIMRLQSGNAAAAEMVKYMMVVLALIWTAIWAYPVIALYLYTTSIKKAVKTGDQGAFSSAIKHQRNMYMYLGILLIISMAYFVLTLGYAIMI